MDLNQLIERIIWLHDNGGNPQQLAQQIIQPNMPIQQMATQFNNMKQGMTNKDALMQLARQGGLTDKNIQGLARILGVKL